MEPCSESTAPIAIPAEMPVMVLPDVHLFPGCLLPLYIFEDRYRQMLAHALGSNRMFCVGNREGIEPDGSDSVSQHSTAGLVRCCVKQDDGTSHLLLLGLKRIRITGWVQEKPFRIASVEEVPTVVKDMDEARRLKTHTMGLFKIGGEAQAKELRAMLEKNDDAEMVCDVISYHFTRCPKLQQKLLGEPLLEERLRMLVAALEKTQCE
ncbi:MAG: LON peptidase substrate-binding domain-containing protein [Verrucomicrobiaceae bacterium]